MVVVGVPWQDRAVLALTGDVSVVEDLNPMVRATLALTGVGADELINDPEPVVVAQVARLSPEWADEVLELLDSGSGGVSGWNPGDIRFVRGVAQDTKGHSVGRGGGKLLL